MTLFAAERKWDVVVVLVLMGALITFEMLGVFAPRMVTITEIIKDFIPMPLRIMIYAWLGWHFIVSDLVRQMSPR